MTLRRVTCCPKPSTLKPSKPAPNSCNQNTETSLSGSLAVAVGGFGRGLRIPPHRATRVRVTAVGMAPVAAHVDTDLSVATIIRRCSSQYSRSSIQFKTSELSSTESTGLRARPTERRGGRVRGLQAAPKPWLPIAHWQRKGVHNAIKTCPSPDRDPAGLQDPVRSFHTQAIRCRSTGFSRGASVKESEAL